MLWAHYKCELPLSKSDKQYFLAESLTCSYKVSNIMDNQPLIISWKFQGVLHMASCPISSVASAPAAAALGKKELQWQTPCRGAGSRNHFAGHSMWVNAWAASLSLFTFLHWRRKWQPTPVFLPGESQGRGSLVGCRLCGRTELDTTGAT